MSNRILICKGKAGLGNRLLSVFGSILYARATGRELFIDWTDRGYTRPLQPAAAGPAPILAKGPERPLRMNSWPHFFRRPALPWGPELPAEVLAAESIAPAVWRGNLHKSVDDLMIEIERDEDADLDPVRSARYTVDFSRVDHAEDVLVRWSYTDEIAALRPHLRGKQAWMQSMNDEEILRTVATEEVELAPGLRERVEHFRAARFGEVTIGVHIRHSDRKNSYEAYPELLERILTQQPGAVIYLATDNKQVEIHFRERFRRVVVTDKWFAEPGQALHRGPICPDKLALGEEALIELYLLSSCDYLIYNKTSTFGLCAGLLSRAPQRQVFEMSTLGDRARDVARRLRRRFTSLAES